MQGVTYDSGTLTPYRNRVTGKEDPLITFAKGQILHLSTCKAIGYRVETEQGEIVS